MNTCNQAIKIRTVGHQHTTGDIINFVPSVEQIIHNTSVNVDLSQYLPLSGGTMFGGLSAPSISANDFYVGTNTIYFVDGNNIVDYVNANDITHFKSNYTLVNSNSANWNEVYNSVKSTSGTWNNALIPISPLTGNWNSVYSNTSHYSGSWNDVYAGVSVLSSNWSYIFDPAHPSPIGLESDGITLGTPNNIAVKNLIIIESLSSYNADDIQGVLDFLGPYWSGTESLNGSRIASYKDVGDGMAGTRLVFYTVDSGNNLTDRLTIDSSGNIGIGTATPVESLDVDGNIRFTRNVIGTANSGLISFGYTEPTASGVYGGFDGSSIQGSYFQLFGKSSAGSGITPPGGGEFVINSLNGDTKFNILNYNGSYITLFSIDANGNATIENTLTIGGQLIKSAAYQETGAFLLSSTIITNNMLLSGNNFANTYTTVKSNSAIWGQTGIYLPLSGGTMTGNINLNNNSLLNVNVISATPLNELQIYNTDQSGILIANDTISIDSPAVYILSNSDSQTQIALAEGHINIGDANETPNGFVTISQPSLPDDVILTLKVTAADGGVVQQFHNSFNLIDWYSGISRNGNQFAFNHDVLYQDPILNDLTINSDGITTSRTDFNIAGTKSLLGLYNNYFTNSSLALTGMLGTTNQISVNGNKISIPSSPHIAGTVFLGGIQFGDNGIAGSINGFISPVSDGVFRFGDSSGGGSPSLVLGSNGPSTGITLKRSGTGLQVKNGDSSGYANISGLSAYFTDALIVNESGKTENGGIKVKTDPLNPSVRAMYLMPPANSGRIYIGDYGQRVYSMDFTNCVSVTNFPSIITISPYQILTHVGNITMAPVNGSFVVTPAAGQLSEFRSGISPMQNRIYNTYTSSTNWEAGIFDWQTTANTLRIGSDKGSLGGSIRDVQFTRGGTTMLSLASNGISIPTSNLVLNSGIIQSNFTNSTSLSASAFGTGDCSNYVYARNAQAVIGTSAVDKTNLRIVMKPSQTAVPFSIEDTYGNQLFTIATNGSFDVSTASIATLTQKGGNYYNLELNGSNWRVRNANNGTIPISASAEGYTQFTSPTTFRLTDNTLITTIDTNGITMASGKTINGTAIPNNSTLVTNTDSVILNATSTYTTVNANSATWGTGGGSSIGGYNTQVQFNSGGFFAGDSDFTYDSSLKTLFVKNGLSTPIIWANNTNGVGGLGSIELKGLYGQSLIISPRSTGINPGLFPSTGILCIGDVVHDGYNLQVYGNISMGGFNTGADSGFSRLSSNKIGVGNGSQGDVSGTLQLNSLIATPTNEPVSPVEGQIYYKSTNHTLTVYNGTNWISLDENDITVDNFVYATSANIINVNTAVIANSATWGTGGGGDTEFFVPAAEMIPSVTNGPLINSAETTTNKINYDTLDFDPSTIQYAQFWRSWPTNWNTFYVKFIWSASSTGDAVWGCGAYSFANNTALDTYSATAQETTSSLSSANGILLSANTSAITPGGTVANGAPTYFRIYRNASSGSDTLAVNSKLLGILITKAS